MIIHFVKTDIEKIIEGENIAYAQIPFIYGNYFDFESDTEHLLTIEVANEMVINSDAYYEGYYRFYCHRDLEKFKNLLYMRNV
ncbi:hypothetical protein [Psychrobacillus sp. FSL H8-0510]|uniref:hypothetical protein n=1 Tax=Psychrobacillus sp. FSL H8-0510 TaxID=2921394 RepID=UPI0030FA5D4D